MTTAIYLIHKGFNVICTTRNPEKIDINDLKSTIINDNTSFSVQKKKNKDGTINYSLKKGKQTLPKEIMDNLDDLVKELKFEALDINNIQSIKQCIAKIEAKEPINVLINNAGFGHFGSIEMLSIEKAKAQFETNVFGQLRIIQLMLPYMRQRNSGTIINVCSMASVFSIPFQSHYSASKAALKTFTEALGVETQPLGIRVMSLSPGDINTSFNKNMAITNERIQNEESLNSLMIDALIKNNPESPESPYFDFTNTVWKNVILNLVSSPGPIIIAKKLYQMLSSEKNKVHYYAASKSQMFFNWLVSGKLSDYFKVKSQASFFGLKFR